MQERGTMVAVTVTNKSFTRCKIRKAKAIGACAAVLLLFVFGGNFAVQDVSAESDQENLQDISTQAADKVAVHIASIKKQLDDLTQDQALINLFAEADVASLESQAEQMQSDFKHALKLRLLLPGNYAVDREAVPPLSYASLDLLRRAEESEAPVDAEAHSMGSDGKHIAFVSRVTDADNKLVGLLSLSMALDAIESVMPDLDNSEVYIEIQQGQGGESLALTQSGDNKLRIGRSVAVTIKGSKWNAASWDGLSSPETSTVSGSSELEESSSMGLIVLILLLVAAGAGGFAFYSGKLTIPKLGLAKLGLGTGKISKNEPEKQVVYEGAVKAIMEGAHPGFENLVPDLPKSDKKTSSSSAAISQGMQGDDVTAIFKPAEILAGDPKQVSKQENVAQSTEDALQAGIVAPEEVSSEAAGQDSVAEVNAEQLQKEVGPTQSTLTQGDVSPDIFRAYDIRGVVSENFSAAVVREIGRAIGSEAYGRGLQRIVVARDGRLTGPELSDALIQGLRASGRDVIDIGMVPTPVLYFATLHLGTDSGVMLTGSHNGPEYNGLKIVLDGEALSGEAITAIRNRITDNDMTEGQGSLEAADVSADYLRKITEDVPVALGGAFKIIVDCGNGVAGQLAPQLYRAMGHDVVELFCDIDGNFPNHHPDPSQPENLQTLIDIVKEEGADLGFAFDGDGDRLGIVDGAGNIIWPDRQMMLFAKDVLSRNQGASIIYDVKCSRHLKEVIEASGGKPLMWKTGHSLIKSKMKEVDAPLAGEMSGHIFFKERWFGFDDALYAGARALEILTNSPGSPTETFAELPDDVSTPELRIPLAEKNHAKAMDIMKKKMTFEGAEITDIDGIRVDFPDGWGLVRPSNTSPFLVARFEAESEAVLERIQAEFRDLLYSVSADLKLPF
ncbi:MAG: phosphomannomutase/phosphoglucomutase [Gammaproteobacteria bacterium]|jgi:phosphomannomutase / phosphoglucomutase